MANIGELHPFSHVPEHISKEAIHYISTKVPIADGNPNTELDWQRYRQPLEIFDITPE